MKAGDRRLRAAALGALSLGVVSLGGCSAPPAPPPPPPPVEKPPQVTGPGDTTPSAEPTQVLRLENGLMAYLRTGAIDAGCHVQLGVFAGALFVAPGLAELAAEVLLQSSSPSDGRISLQQTIERLGGSVSIEVGMLSVWFDVRAPRGRTAAICAALREALESTSRSRSQIERMRDELVARLADVARRDPLRATTRALLLAERGTESYLNGLLDLDASQVGVFHERMYRPERCVLHVSDGMPLRVLEQAVTAPPQTAIAGWRPGVATPGTSDLRPSKMESGVDWIAVDDSKRAHLAVVMLRPAVGEAEFAASLAVQACLTLDGTGGRLEVLQQEAGLAHVRWQTRIERTPESEALVLTAEASTEEVEKLWRTVLRARQSLAEVPPTRSELQLALRRARLTSQLPLLDAGARLRFAGRMAMRNQPTDLVRRQLDQLATTSAADFASLSARLAAQPTWLVVAGGRPPAEFTEARLVDLLPPRFSPETTTGPAPIAAAAAAPWLDRAIATCGGRVLLSRLDGFSASTTLKPGAAPAVLDQIDWHRDGTLQRRRTVLDQVVTTTLDGTAWSEALGTTRRSLTAEEASALRNEMGRHPTMLLAACARGEIAFRPIAEREVGDRRLMVLEAADERFDRLRLHIDVESSLVRVVETWQPFADGSLVHVRETWSDYRVVDGLRVPHHRRASWNDGQHESDATWSDWRLRFRGR